MKTTWCIILLASMGRILHGDLGIEPRDYSFVILSPHRDYYAVQVLQSWTDHTNGPPNGVSTIRKTGRFEVNRSRDGERVWQIDTVLGLERNLLLADDPDYVVELATALSSYGLTGLDGGKVADAPADQQLKILNQTAIRFYKRGLLLNSHSLRDMDVQPTAVKMSVSRVRFFEPMDARFMGHWNWPVDELAMSTNPRFNQVSRTISFFGYDGRERVFDYTTGKLVHMDTQEEADARDKDPGDPEGTQKKNEAWLPTNDPFAR